MYAQWGTELYVSNEGAGDKTGRDSENTVSFTDFLKNQTFDKLVVTETLVYDQASQSTDWFGTGEMPLTLTRSDEFTEAMVHLQQGSIDVQYIIFDGEEREGTDPLIKVGYDSTGLSPATLTIGNGTIIENNANKGIVFEGTNGYLDVKGDCKVRNNTNGNVVYNNDSGTRVQVADALNGASIGLSPSNIGAGAVIVEDDSFYTPILDTDKDCFILDRPLDSGLSLTINEEKNEIIVIDTTTNSLVEMVTITGGDLTRFNNGEDGETHTVSVSNYSIGKFEITQSQWNTVMGNTHPGVSFTSDYGLGDVFPAYSISWYDAVLFCNKLSERDSLESVYFINAELTTPVTSTPTGDVYVDWTATGYRLPTEAEWEYAAKAGGSYTYSGSNAVDDVAVYSSKTQAVGSKDANTWGIFDMSGNVYEWCWDWYDGDYDLTSTDNPKGPDSSLLDSRVLRSGSWDSGDMGCEILYRENGEPDLRAPSGTTVDVDAGFRVVRNAQ